MTAPLGVVAFLHAPFVPIRHFAERDLTTIQRWTELDRGGFAALEEPDLVVSERQAFGRPLKKR
jgi:epoxide hydrolase